MVRGGLAGGPAENGRLRDVHGRVRRIGIGGVDRQLQNAGRDRLPEDRWALPRQMSHGGAAIVVPFHLDAIELARDEIDRRDVVGAAVIGPVVDDPPAVEPEPHAVVRRGDELVRLGERGFEIRRPAGRDAVAEAPCHLVAAPVVVDRVLGPRDHGDARQVPCPRSTGP